MNEAFLKSTVLVTYQTDRGQSFGSGFLLFRAVQGDQGHVFLVTNKHVLPPNDRPRTVTIRVNVKSSTDPEVNDRLRQLYGLPDHIDGFLVDAGVFPGSSGSVVILRPQPTTIGPGGETVVSGAKKIPYVLGVVSGSIPIADTALGSVQRLGLGVVFGANTIRETIELFYREQPPN